MERRRVLQRRTDMRRLLLPLGLIGLLAGCGASSAGGLDQSALPEESHTYDSSPAPSSLASPAAPQPLRTAGQPSPAPSPVRVGTVTATAGTATVGPGTRTSPIASPSPRPTPSPTAGTVTVTDDDSGATVRLLVGQRLRVRLSRDTYDPPESSADRVVVRRTSTGGYPSDQPVDATFAAVGKGSADVTAQSDAACFHTEPRCMMAQREWRVTVVVS